MTRIQKLSYITCIFAATVFASNFALAQKSSELSADLPDARTMAIQQKVEKLYDAGEFKRAFLISRNELVPIGDKYAQYMLGYMLLSGQGVDEDRIAASTWYRLSAERGTPEFVAVRDNLLSNMTAEELRQSDIQYAELRILYCDLAVLLSSIKRNIGELEKRRGSRSSRLTSASETYASIYGRLESRIKLLKALGEFHDLGTDPEKIDIRELERRVQERIDSYN